MKKLIVAIALVLSAAAGIVDAADVRVRSYTRQDGTFVQAHYRSAPDGNVNNNWSTYPNVNPHTGAVGTRRADSGYGGSSTWSGQSVLENTSVMNEPRYRSWGIDNDSGQAGDRSSDGWASDCSLCDN